MGSLWVHFGSQNGIRKSMKFWMRFWRRNGPNELVIWGRPGGMRGVPGGIIGGYKDAKIAGETRPENQGQEQGNLAWCLARRSRWGGGSLCAFRRAALCGKVGVSKCWLTSWVVLSGLIGAWFLYVKWWFDFSFGTHFGNSGWCFWWWVSILAALTVPWASF